MVQIFRVHWVLLHLLELVSLEDISQEPIMSLLETLQVVLKHLVTSFEYLYFTQGKLSVNTAFNFIKLEYILSDLLDIQLPH